MILYYNFTMLDLIEQFVTNCNVDYVKTDSLSAKFVIFVANQLQVQEFPRI